MALNEKLNHEIDFLYRLYADGDALIRDNDALRTQIAALGPAGAAAFARAPPGLGERPVRVEYRHMVAADADARWPGEMAAAPFVQCWIEETRLFNGLVAMQNQTLPHVYNDARAARGGLACTGGDVLRS